MSNAGFSGAIPLEISNLRLLVTLDLSSKVNKTFGNYLTLEISNLSMLVETFSQLEELYLDGLPVYGSEWCEALSSSLPNLRVLSLSRCFPSGPIDLSLKKLRYLSVIHLDGNNFSALFPGFVANFPNLTSLQLCSSGLYGTFPTEIFQ
ncbi:LRR domain containing protein, partial [Parasponia andersonii]